MTALALAAVFLVGGTAQTDAAFPGTNGKIAFHSNRDGNSEIYVMDADGSRQTNLTNHTAFDILPAWSPDGSKIVFVSDRDGPPKISEIYVMNADGSGQTRLTFNPASDGSPDWQALPPEPGKFPPTGGPPLSNTGIAHLTLYVGVALALAGMAVCAVAARRRD
jgi:hypothetical protein